MSSQAEADRRHRPGAEGGGALPARVAYLPGGPLPFAPARLALLCSASPRTARPGLDARDMCRGLSSFGIKCLRKDKELPCLFRGRGGELS